MFWLFPDCINKKKLILIFIFAMYQNYPLALNNHCVYQEQVPMAMKRDNPLE